MPRDSLEPDVLSLERLRDVTSGDWGWFTTFTDNLAQVREAAPDLLDADDGERVNRPHRPGRRVPCTTPRSRCAGGRAA